MIKNDDIIKEILLKIKKGEENFRSDNQEEAWTERLKEGIGKNYTEDLLDAFNRRNDYYYQEEVHQILFA